ncbi:GatB/YqeY domain-containing protein [Candidatus Saccharibacteria bacterium]|nr:GatB/YqeY domain-containing protein [Candidatus Saccharibacteria bacterium]
MALREQINNDIKAALLGGNRFKGDVLRNFKAVILNEEVAQNKRETGLDDETIERLLAREVKKRHESAELYETAGRTELAEGERAEAAVLVDYLPSQLTEDELKAEIIRIKDQLGLDGMSAMGQLIGAVKKELGSSADGATVARLVKDLLN